tara:strand:+ start:184 stop:618 length:435 start_codon:yes stop_codon:yes gene_type:complete
MPLEANYTEIANFKNVVYEYYTPKTEEQRQAMTRRTPMWGPDWGEQEGGELCRLNPATWALVFGASLVGFNKITDDNAEEIYVRFKIIENIYGESISDPHTGECRFMTLDDVTQHIGMTINVNPMTKRQFHASCIRILRDLATK